jgi:hypothetical protein
VRSGAALVLYELSRREQLVATRSDLHDAREG